MRIKIWTVYIKTKVHVTPILTAKWNTVTKLCLKSNLYWTYDLRSLKKKQKKKTSNLSLSVAAREIVEANLPLKYTLRVAEASRDHVTNCSAV